MFVVIEGIEGTGKSTVCGLVAELLRARGIDVVVKPEFPEGELAAEFREALSKGLFLAQHLTMHPAAAFFYLAYAQVMTVSATRPGGLTLGDRYLHTLAIYQSHFINAVPKPDPPILLASLEQLFATFGLPLPDVVFLLEAPLATIRERLTQREGRSPSEEEEMVMREFQEIYRRLRGGNKGALFFSIDADRAPNEVARDISQHLIEALPASVI